MRSLIAGNWKMNATLAEAAALAAAIREGAADTCDLAVFPPTTALARVGAVLAGSAVAVGGQDCHERPSGAWTGDISAAMLADAGATWVILGHSERRAGHAETDAIVRAKVAVALAAGLAPIVCVGETGPQRAAGQALAVVRGQLAGSLPQEFAGTVAYEPVWAIGTGLVAHERDVAEMHAAIRAVVGPGVRILYGGSVKPDNAAVLLALPDVDGALVGGASLDPAAFLAIAAAAPTLANKQPAR